jgi:hypothetical protein
MDLPVPKVLNLVEGNEILSILTAGWQVAQKFFK